MNRPILRIAVPSPLRRTFDYLAPADGPAPQPGMRVRVPFGRRETVGVVVGVAGASEVPQEKLRPARLLDEAPLLPPPILTLLEWAAGYYHHAPGEVFTGALPVRLRRGEAAAVRGVRRWTLTPAGAAADPGELRRAPRQAALLAWFQQRGAPAGDGELTEAGHTRAAAARLLERGWLEATEGSCLEHHTTSPNPAPEPGPAQAEAIAAVGAALGTFAGFLLDGVTGSGKTEVYLRVIEQVLAAERQVLVLVPEIGLTPQLVQRFRRRFAAPIALLHSNLAEGERLCAWLAAARGEAQVVIGTRSAVFTPLPQLGLIVIDEEHDTSFKQQDGFRYSARDVAVMRARRAGVPVLLGSATPSLESLHNVEAKRYRRLRLPERAGSACHPAMHLLDVRHQKMDGGLSAPLLRAMRHHLERGGQVLLFLNRRGFAPTLLCHDCGWVAGCARCDAHLTLYAGDRRLRCHHCGAERRVPAQCPECGSVDLRPVGQGTERVEQALAEAFPGVPTVRIDRDATRRKGAMQALLDDARGGRARILVGTQMLAKGHHFPDVTLVGILDADQGLFSADFRAGERMAQLIVQVAGRAGRAERPGEVLIQTHHPDHPLLQTLVQGGYHAFAGAALAERREAALPPYSHLALLRAEAVAAEPPLAFLEAARAQAEALGAGGVMLLGPVPAPMERRAGRYRAQLLLQAEQRADLHTLLGRWLPALEGLASGRKVRWSLDVDPAETF